MNPDPIYDMMLTFENELCRILEEKLGKDRSRKDPEGKTGNRRENKTYSFRGSDCDEEGIVWQSFY